MASLNPALEIEALIQQHQQLVTGEPYHQFSLIVEENSKLRQQDKDLNITNDQLLNAIVRLKQKNAIATKQNAEYSTQLEHLTQENQQLKRSLVDAEGTIGKKDKELGQHDEEITELEAMLKRREAEIDSLQRCLYGERKAVKVAEDARKAVEHDLTRLTREISSHRERLERLGQFAAELSKPDRDVMYVRSKRNFGHC